MSTVEEQHKSVLESVTIVLTLDEAAELRAALGAASGDHGDKTYELFRQLHPYRRTR